jgi:hypothetical protein
MQRSPRKLVDSGANVNYLGKFVSSYDNDDIFLVTVLQVHSIRLTRGSNRTINASFRFPAQGTKQTGWISRSSKILYHTKVKVTI